MSALSSIISRMTSSVVDKAKDMASNAGLSLLSNVISGGAKEVTARTFKAVKDKTGIDLVDLAEKDSYLKETEKKKLAKFEKDEQEFLLKEYKLSIESQAIVNGTMAVEYTTESIFKSGWRPYIGWVAGSLLASLGAILIGGFVWSFFSASLKIGDFFKVFGELVKNCDILFLTIMPILGINIHNRSKDKKLKAGDTSPGFIGGILKKIAG